MAGIPKVKVTFDADLTGLKQGTAQAETELTGFEKGVAKFGAAAKAAFAAAAAAAAAYAVKLGVDGVKAAIEDEQAQSRLAQTLEKAAGATSQAVAQTEAFISKMQLATGVADTDLRNAMGRLTLSTNDVTKAQDLLALSLDISKATGKSVETVANALGKAYDGQNTALGKLGIGLSSSELKTMSFEQTQKRLSDLFGGAAARNAETFQGKIDIMRQRFAEFQEGIGNKLIPILLDLFNFFEQKLGPVFAWLKKNALDPVMNAVMDNKDTFIGLFEFLSKTLVPFFTGGLAAAIATLGKAAGFVVEAVAAGIRALEPIINFAIAGINKVITGINYIKPGADIAYIPKLDTSSVAKATSAANNVKVPTFTASTSSSGTSITSTGGSTGGAAGAASTIAGLPTLPSGGGTLPFTSIAGSTFNPAGVRQGENVGLTINVNAPSVIDEEGFKSAIVSALNNSSYRGTGGGNLLVAM